MLNEYGKFLWNITLSSGKFKNDIGRSCGFFLLNAASLAEKQQIPILMSLD
jgi:hypothetical protein